MYIKRDLDLFVGYPGLDGTWVSLIDGKEPEIIILGGKHIHNATFTINKLVRDFPIALPKIVGDVGDWSNRYRNLLEIIKQSIHTGSQLPNSLVDLNQDISEGEKKLFHKLIKDNPTLGDVLSNISWITFLKPEAFKDALSWVARNAEKTDLIYRNLGPSEGLTTIMKLWRLSMEAGEDRLHFIALWLSNPGIFDFPMEKGYNCANKIYTVLGRKRSDPIPSTPKARFGKDLVQWVNWLYLQDVKTIRRSIDLFALVCDISLIESWKQWWKSVNALIRDAEKIPRPLSRNDPINSRLNIVREKIKTIGESAPPSLHSKMLFALIKKWSENTEANEYSEIFKALGILPVIFENAPVRLAFLNYWNNLIEDNDISKKIIISIIKEFSKYIKEHGEFSCAIKLWEKVLDSWKAGQDPDRYIFTIDDVIIDEMDTQEDISRCFHFLGELYQDGSVGQLEEDEKRNIILLFRILGREFVRESFLELRRYGLSCNYISIDLLRLAVDIVQKNYQNFGMALKILINNSERYYDISKVIQPVIRVCKNSGYGSFLSDAVISGQIRVLCGISLKAGLIEYFGEEGAVSLPSPIEKETGWISHYPQELQEPLLKLAAADENAEATAKRILSKEFPDADRILKEIAGLINLIVSGEDKEGVLRKRVETLRKRLAENPPSIGGQRLNNLGTKLNHAAMMGLLKRWDGETDAGFKAFIKKYLNLDEFPEWLERKNVLEIILATTELNTTYQKIVQKILLRRATDLPWDFRDEARNSSFVEGLDTVGINMVPWLDGNDRVTVKMANGEELTISIERDPIEILSMGLHFKTCLSPGGINFFSVFSNILDVNKQVVYGKTLNGSVKARALIGLSNEGGILTFHPYCNDVGLDFQAVLKEFVHKLGGRMGTAVLPSGSISRLIAPDWYDDGPQDLTEKFPFVLDNSDFRKRIKEMDMAELLYAMKKEIEPLRLNELTIPFFVFLPELRECKKLIDVLFPYILKLKNLPSDVLLKFLEALWETGSLQMLEMLMPRMIEHMLGIYDRYYYWAIKDWMELLIKFSPGKALFVLRKTCDRGVRSWEEDDPERIAAAGMAYLKLNRQKQAAGLFRLCLEKNPEYYVKEICIRQLKELEE